jgi:hypothetical protein
MTNPVRQNASQLPSPPTPFFNPDGQTLSPPYRAFFRTLAAITGLDQGSGSDLTTLIKELSNSVDTLFGEVLVPSPQTRGALQGATDLVPMQRVTQAANESPVIPPRGLYPRTPGAAGQVLLSAGPSNEAQWGSVLSVASPAVLVTLTASPFTFTAPSNGALVVAGGTVSAIQYKRAPNTVPLGVIAGQFVIAATDQITITYTAAPTVVFIPF